MEEKATKPSVHFPWTTFAQNVAIIGGAHLLGRVSGGVAVKALAATPLGRRFGNITPETQRAVARRMGDAFMVGSGLALHAQDLASHARIEDAMEERMRRLEGKMEKKASVYAIYSIALRSL